MELLFWSGLGFVDPSRNCVWPGRLEVCTPRCTQDPTAVVRGVPERAVCAVPCTPLARHWYRGGTPTPSAACTALSSGKSTVHQIQLRRGTGENVGASRWHYARCSWDGMRGCIKHRRRRDHRSGVRTLHWVTIDVGVLLFACAMHSQVCDWHWRTCGGILGTDRMSGTRNAGRTRSARGSRVCAFGGVVVSGAVGRSTRLPGEQAATHGCVSVQNM